MLSWAGPCALPSPGAGKSIALWLSLQCLYHFDHLRWQRDVKQWEKDHVEWKAAAGARQPDDPPLAPEPQKPVRADSIQNKGTLYGLGCHMTEQGGRAFWALHEGTDLWTCAG